MFIKVEPAEFFMYRVILIFDLEAPDGEDREVREYMAEWELEPKYQRSGDFEGRDSELMQFGGCYLGRHLGKISEIQRSHVERELVTAEIVRLLDAAEPPVALPAAGREETLRELAQTFHTPEAFRTNDDGLLEAALDDAAVRRAARDLLNASTAGD